MLTFKNYDKNEEFGKCCEALFAESKDLLKKAQAGESVYADSLGWLSVDEWADDAHLKVIEDLAAKVRANADVFVLIGVGGSNNAARSVIEALGTDGPEIVYAGNTLSSNAMNAMLKKLEDKSVYIDCIAKNFETLEPGASFRVLRQLLEERYGDGAAERIIATGTRGSSLDQLCQEHGYTFIDFPIDIGGRFTAMSNVGLLPMAVAGIDIRALVKGAKDMEECLRKTGPEENPAYLYACLRNAYYLNGYRVEILSSFEPQFRFFYKWWQQLYAESEGKDNKGIFPVACEFSEDLHSVGQFIQDGPPVIFETFLTVKDGLESLVVKPDDKKDYFDYLDNMDFRDINRIDFEATIGAHSAKLPCAEISVGGIDAYNFGQLFYFFQFQVYIDGLILGVNPFDQPGVEEYKHRMFKALGKES